SGSRNARYRRSAGARRTRWSRIVCVTLDMATASFGLASGVGWGVVFWRAPQASRREAASTSMTRQAAADRHPLGAKYGRCPPRTPRVALAVTQPRPFVDATREISGLFGVLGMIIWGR